MGNFKLIWNMFKIWLILYPFWQRTSPHTLTTAELTIAWLLPTNIIVSSQLTKNWIFKWKLSIDHFKRFIKELTIQRDWKLSFALVEKIPSHAYNLLLFMCMSLLTLDPLLYMKMNVWNMVWRNSFIIH